MAIKNTLYFASDFHLGVPNATASRQREQRLISWLNFIEPTAKAIYLVGDIFDFWFEYKTVVPKGFVRLLGKLAQLSDKGVELHIFTGNHDLWMFSYLQEELGIPVHHQPLRVQCGNKNLLIAHGDGLGPGDKGYKFLKKYIFQNKLCQFMLHWLHPDWGIALANYFSKSSRKHTEEPDFLGPEKEWLVQYAQNCIDTDPHPPDYFIFGHRHIPKQLSLYKQSLNTEKPLNGVTTLPDAQLVYLGDWLTHNTYAAYNCHTDTLQLKHYQQHKTPIQN